MDSIRVQQQIEDSIQAKKEISVEVLVRAGEVIKQALQSGHKVLLAGNGGSAADAQHIAAELVGRFLKERVSLPAIALTANSSTVTAIANDYGYDKVFARQVEGLGQSGDVLVLITTSGNSINLIEAAKVAKQKELTVIGLTGKGGGALKDHCDHHLTVNHQSTPRIQEAHILMGHILCAYIDE
ncbi:phosphoheptose isomerase [Candidatus Marinamargulisbacteria bacterium SCGC AG-439-L15]|nr:phosphoheptose isomerase [Candidatus Marinamargulisbacteria bacterium SCGC AG-439-L15]